MSILTTAWMLGCVCGFFMGVTVAVVTQDHSVPPRRNRRSMPEPYHLPWDIARCLGAESDDPELVYRPECDACLRRLAPPHPTRNSVWIAPQPEPCGYRIIPWYDPD